MLEIRGKSIIEINVNGSLRNVVVRPKDTLLYVLRKQLGLTIAKSCCDNGECDECTILLDGWPINACFMLAVEAVGHEITTIEALKENALQSSLIEKFAISGGYCIPSMIINCYALDNIYPNATDDVLEEWLATNTCKCTGYHKINEAVKSELA